MRRTLRRRRKDFIGLHVSASLRFWAAAAALPPFFFIESLVFKSALTALFAVLAVCAGKRIRWGYFAVLLFSIVFFHLLIPVGRVLAEIGPLRITDGALKSGLMRGVTLIGMVFLSVAAVRPELELPGRFGGLLGRTFFHFESLLEWRGAIDRKDFFGSLDRLLMERLNPNAPADRAAGGERSGGEADCDSADGRQRDAGISSEPDMRGGPAGSGRLSGAVRGRFFAAAFTVLVWGLWLVSLWPPLTGNG